ncbi:MAG: hypothetical protein FWD57_06505 [Polyangiaceae bacterium]|nr:hypothetical protein [Polyangiaceae bacterium]
MFDRGYWRIGSVSGVPIRLHWTIPLGCAIFSGFHFAPAFWLGFVLLVIAHELGHAWMVRQFGFRNHSIDVTGFGGMCRWSGHATSFERSAIAWGGVLAQLAILLMALIYLLFLGSPTNQYAAEAIDVLTRANLMLMALNLIPFPPLDGALAWKILQESRFQMWRDSIRSQISRLFSTSKAKPSHSDIKASVIDFEQERRKRASGQATKPAQKPAQTPAQNPQVKGKSASELADELIKLSEEAARARRKRDEN